MLNNPAISLTLTPYTLSKTHPASIAAYNDVYPSLLLPFTPYSFLEIEGCIPDFDLVMGEPDVNFDLLACVQYNGAPLTGSVLATLSITVTDISNSNADALTYPYLNLNGSTLEIATSSQGVPIPFFIMLIHYQVTVGLTYHVRAYRDLEIGYAEAPPIITVPPTNGAHELGEGAVAFAMTVTDINSDPLNISFDSGNALLDACCSVSSAGGDNYDVDCNCSDVSLVDGGNDVAYTVTLIANDGTADSLPATFQLTITSPNKAPIFTGLQTPIEVKSGTNTFVLNINY